MRIELEVPVILGAALFVVGCSVAPTSEESGEAAAQAVEMSGPAAEWQKHACKEGEPTDAADVYQPQVCRGLDEAANALEVDASSPTIARFRDIWRRVYDPYLALTGRAAILRLVPGDAMQHTPAMTCPGPTPTVYFSADVIDETLEQDKYPESFLAFISSHELAHRLNDYSCEGYSTSFGGNSREALADLRGAFFTTVAGFSTKELADEAVVDRFLEVESKVRTEARQERRDALMEALANYPLYEAIYQNGLTMSLADERELVAAARLVGWADELMTIESVPVPEFKLLRAMVLMRSAIPDAPWIDAVGDISKSAPTLRCVPVTATHTALHEDIEPGDSLMGPKGRGIAERRRAVKNLELALEWVNHAENRFGASPLIAGNLRSCIQFYLDEPELALAEHNKTVRKADDLPTSVQEALAANEALFELAVFTAENERPDFAEDLPAWRKKLADAGDWSASSSVERVVAEAMGEEPASPKNALGSLQAAGGPAVLADAGLPQTDLSSELGACPEGMQRVGMVPAKESADKSGTTYGITFCEPTGAQRVRVVSRVRLSEALEPAYDGVQIDILSVSAPEGLSVGSLLGQCPDLEQRALTPDGAQIYSGSCDGEPETVVYTRGDAVERIDVLRRAEDS